MIQKFSLTHALPTLPAIYVFLLAGLGRCGEVCWSQQIPQIPTVGFNIGLTQCTSSIAFPNGTFIDIALLETNTDYQACVLSQIHDEGYGIRSARDIAPDKSDAYWEPRRKEASYYYQAISWAQPLLGLSQTVKNPPPSCLNATQNYMQGIINSLKTKSEDYLRMEISEVTITTPIYFSPAIQKALHASINSTSLAALPCNDFHDSDLAATLSTRMSQLQQKPRNFTTPTQWLLGNFTVEEVVVINYTEDIFTFTSFQLYVGHQIWQSMPNGHFLLAQNSSSSTKKLGKVQRNEKFWSEIKARIRKIILDSSPYIHPKRILRLLITGSSSNDGEMLEAVQAALTGEFLPRAHNTTTSPQPRAIIMTLSRKELSEKWEKFRPKKTGLCRAGYNDDEWTVRDYEPDLLSMISSTRHPISNENANDGRGFEASRGGALLGLMERVLSCQDVKRETEEVGGGSFRWDNQLHYGMVYRGDRYDDEEKELLEGVLDA